MKIAISGATGYIGQRLIRRSVEAGHEVIALSRRPLAVSARLSWQSYHLADPAPIFLPDDVEVVFHLAAYVGKETPAKEIEVGAAQRLIEASLTVGARFVFISSQTSRQDALSEYGQTKWEIERLVLAAGGIVVRPGQVYGGPEHGLFGELCHLVRRVPILPRFVPSPLIQPIHVDDLVVALLSVGAQPPGTLVRIADPEPVDFTYFLGAVARGRATRLPIFAPVPSLPLRLVADCLGPNLSRAMNLDRLVSLLTLPHMDTAADLHRLGLSLRPIAEGSTRSGAIRRAIIREGATLLTYVLRARPRGSLIRRYTKSIESIRNGRPLQLPWCVQIFPSLMSMIDNAPGTEPSFRAELTWRLEAALLIAEASPQGAKRFLGDIHSRSWLSGALGLVAAMLGEGFRRLAQVIARPCLSRIGRRGIFE